MSVNTCYGFDSRCYLSLASVVCLWVSFLCFKDLYETDMLRSVRLVLCNAAWIVKLFITLALKFVKNSVIVILS